MSPIALVAERACSLADFCSISFHTCDWSARAIPLRSSDSLTWALFAARPVAKCVRDDAAKLRDLWLQRPASTQVTGTMTSAVGRDQDRQVDRPILFRADEFLPVDNQNRELTLVQNLDFRNVARFAHLGDMQGAARKRRVEGVVVRLRR